MQLICGVRWFDGRTASRAIVDDMVRAMLPAARIEDIPVITDGPLAMTAIEMGPRSPARGNSGGLAEGGPYCLAADMRIYTGLYDQACKDQPVTQCLAQRISQDGVDGLKSVNGDYAIAYWQREERTLILARDHFGVRPLQYVHRPGAYIAFASLPSALIATGLASTELDELVVASYPINGYAPKDRTYFRDVKSVEAAHALTIDSREQISARRFWRVDISQKPRFDRPQHDVATELRQLLERAVERRLPERGPAGGHCSGGVDSTTISVIAARALRPAHRTYHAFSFQEEASEDTPRVVDEMQYVSDVIAREDNMRLWVANSPGFYKIYDDDIDPHTFLPTSPMEPEQVVLHRAAEEGVGILFSGWGGDQLVTSAGRGAEVELFRAGKWKTLARQIGALATLKNRSHVRTFFNLVVLPSTPREIRSRYLAWRGLPSGFVLPYELIGERYRDHALYEDQPISPDSRLNRRTWLEYSWISKRLEMFAQLGARYGIAYTYPLLDLDVIDFAIGVPGIYFCRNGVKRSLIRDAAIGLLPESVRLRQEKLAPFPAETLRNAKEKDRMIEILRRLEHDPAVRRMLDLDNLIATVQRGLSPEAIRSAMEKAFAAGQQFSAFENKHERAILIAMYFAKNRPQAGQ